MPKRKSQEEFIMQCIERHGNKYIYSKSQYKESHIKVIITCPIHGDWQQTPANHLSGQGCYKCSLLTKSDGIRLTNDDIDKLLISNNRGIIRLGNYKNNYTKIEWKCLACNKNWKSVPNSIQQGIGCPSCGDTKLSNNDIDNRLINNKTNIKRVDNYTNSYTAINWQCLLCHNKWMAQPCEILRSNKTKKGAGSGCPECARNKNEKIVGSFLKERNVKYEKLIIKLNNKKLYPDYWVPELNLIIEYNGIQHYQPTCFGNMTVPVSNDCFAKQQLRDDMLKKHCLNNKINLLSIDGRQFKGAHLIDFLKKYFEGVLR